MTNCRGQSRGLVALAVWAATLAAWAAPAVAGGLPRLLAYAPDDNTLGFVVRPGAMQLGPLRHFEHMLGPGVSLREYNRGHGGPIRWRRWGAAAIAPATDVTTLCTSFCLNSRGVRSTQVLLRAWRVRHNRYTRLAITYTRSGRTDVFQYRHVRVDGYLAYTWCRAGAGGCVLP